MPLTTEQMVALGRLLDQALELEPSQLEAWFAGLAPEHAALLPLLREVLADRQSEQAQAFLATGPQLGGGGFTEADSARPGSLVGPYRLLRELGHGGMGTVWLAERMGEGFKRTVALKLPRLAWDAGLAERMARERDIAAVLEHPSIARLYDAGLDEQGRPYLAFEYIDGQPIDTWCNEHKLGVRKRLKLVVEVTRAVAYAHGRLVVHRDIKPSNVLVTADGHAHLLDFGIAKLLAEGAQDTGATGLTQELGRMLTPLYASPEHMRGEPITVASDVYSLGVLSYELLTGSAPYRPKRASQAALEEEILKGEAVLASTQAPDKATGRALKGEVDAILAKALKHEPGKRYATADALADDIERHLTGECVLAQPDSTWYRLSKALRRHWIGVSAVSAVVAAVVLGSVVAVVQAQRAAQSANREQLVKDFVSDVFRVNLRPSSKSGNESQASAQEFMTAGADLIQTRFEGQPELQAELFGVVGGLFFDMGAYQLAADYMTRQSSALASGGSAPSIRSRAMLATALALLNAERPEQAKEQVERAVAFARDDDLIELDGLILKARICLALYQSAQAAATLEDVENHVRKKGQATSSRRAWIVASIARLFVIGDRFDDAIHSYDTAIELAKESGGETSVDAVDMQLALALALVRTTRPERSSAYFDKAISTLRSLGGAHEVRAAIESARYAFYRKAGGHGSPAEAIAALQKSLDALAASRLPIPPWFVPQIRVWMGDITVDYGDIEGGLRVLEENVPIVKRYRDDPRSRSLLDEEMGGALMFAGRHEIADRWYRDKLKGAMSLSNRVLAFAYGDVALNLAAGGFVVEAEEVLEQAPVPDRSPEFGEDPAQYLRTVRAMVALAKGDGNAAVALLSADAPVNEVQYGSFERTLLGEALCRTGRSPEGVKLLQAQLADHVKAQEQGVFHRHAPWTARLRAVIGHCAANSGNRGLAIQLAKTARASFGAQPGVSEYFKAPLVELEQRLGIGDPRSRLR